MTASRRSSSELAASPIRAGVQWREILQFVLQFVVGKFAGADLPARARRQREQPATEDNFDFAHAHPVQANSQRPPETALRSPCFRSKD